MAILGNGITELSEKVVSLADAVYCLAGISNHIWTLEELLCDKA